MRSGDNAYAEYENESDGTLILRLRDGEDKIQDYILDKYKNLVRSKARSMYILGAEPEDPGRDTSFYTFAELCISRQVYTAVTASGRKKHMPLNSYVSLYSGDDGNEGEKMLEETLPALDGLNPEAQIIDRENVEEIESIIENELSGFEKQVLELYLTGMSYTEIAKVLGKDEKSTDNALSRAKSKIKKAIKK